MFCASAKDFVLSSPLAQRGKCSELSGNLTRFGGGGGEKRKPWAGTFDGEGSNFDTEIPILIFHTRT